MTNFMLTGRIGNGAASVQPTEGDQMTPTIIGEVAGKLGLDEDTVRMVVAEFATHLHRHAVEYQGDFIGEDLWCQMDRQAFFHLLGFLNYLAENYSWDTNSAQGYLMRLGSRQDWKPFADQMKGWRVPRPQRGTSEPDVGG